MSERPSAKARRVLEALLQIGWRIKRQSGSHRTLSRDGWSDLVFAFHDNEEIGPRILARLAKHTGLEPEDLACQTPNVASLPVMPIRSPRADSAVAAASRSSRMRPPCSVRWCAAPFISKPR